MPKKATGKKRAASKTRATRVNEVGTMKGGVVAGKINVKGSWIQGNQYNDYRQQIANIATPAQFIAEAQKVQAQIAEAKKQPDLLPSQTRKIDTAEADVQDAIAEAQKEKPDPKSIQTTLTSAAETMASVGKTMEAAQSMGEKVDKVIRSIDWGRLAVGATALADLAARVFGSLPH